MVAISPYATALALGRPAPTHVVPGTFNADRIQAYATYEDMWNNVAEAYSKLLRDGDDPKARRYVPLIRGLIEATNRYLAVDFEHVWTPVPGATAPNDDQMAEFRARLDGLWAREEIPVKFLSNKRWAMIKGDALLLISADPAKAEGTRIRITEIEPDQYFPILDRSDGERVLGCYLASIVLDDEENDIVQRIEYRRVLTPEQSSQFNGTPIGSIFYRIGYYEPTGWDDREPGDELAPVDTPSWAQTPDGAPDLAAGVALPPVITTLPVYHVRNRRRGGPTGIFGVSEVQGMETLLAGVIQNTTDEDTAVAMQGLGVYWTDSGRPRNAAGKEVEWEIGPASVAELEKDGKFGRVDGISTVQPMQDHIGYLSRAAREASAISDVAAGGNLDSTAAVSGVALKIRFMPTLANTAEKEMELASKWTQLLFDLTQMWFPAYEGWTPLPLQPSVHFGDPLPIDRTATLAEIVQMLAVGLVSKEWAVGYLKDKLGYDFPDGMLEVAAAEQQATLDAMGARIDAAAAGTTPVGALPAGTA